MTAPVLSLPVKVLRSATAGRRPGDGNFRPLTDGELFFNTQDRVLCYLSASGTLLTIPFDPAFFGGLAPLASPALTGTPTAPTPAASDNSQALATTAFVGAALSAILAQIEGGAPGALDTLKELADALGDDPNYAATTAAALALRLRVDAAQNLSAAQQAQALANLGAYGALTTDAIYAKKRNRIINPTHIINQIPGAPSVASGYIVDGWFLVASAAGATGQQAQVNGPNGSTARLRVTIGTAKASLASTDVLCIGHVIEVHRMSDLQWGLPAAKTVALRFGFKGPTGNYTYTLRNGASNRSYVGSFTITAGQANTDTLQTAIIPGDVAGTWTSSAGIQFYITLACGTAYQGPTGSWQGSNLVSSTSQVNGWASTSNVFELFECGLYAGGTVPAFEPVDALQTLIDCQRYYVVQTGTIMRYTNSGSYQGTVINVPKLSMRVAPSLTVTNTGNGNYPGALSVGGDALCTQIWFGASGSIGDYTGYQVINDARF